MIWLKVWWGLLTDYESWVFYIWYTYRCDWDCWQTTRPWCLRMTPIARTRLWILGLLWKCLMGRARMVFFYPHVCLFGCSYVCQFMYNLIERTPPPRGGFFVVGFANQQPGGRGSPWRTTPIFWKKWGCSSWGFVPSGSWLGNHRTKKLLRGRRFLSIKLYVDE